jgi:uncharacterized pyridoxamine 5'-phosphate oxidase family protein
VHETEADLDALQALLDRSHDRAGSHLADIMAPERRLHARLLVPHLAGICVLNLATVTADGRPLIGPVDGLFYRGEWYFGSSPESVRFRHIRKRPAVSTSYTVGERLGVIVHGEAHEIDLKAPKHAGYRDYLRAVYLPTQGPDFLDFADQNLAARITPHKMFVYWNPDGMPPKDI